MTTAVARPSATAGWLRGAELGVSRLRWRSMLAITVLVLSVAAVAAVVLRAREPLTAPGHALGVVLRWLVPLSSFAVCSLIVGRARMDDSVWPICSHGIPRRRVVLGLATVAIVVCALVATAAGSLSLALAYGRTPGLTADLSTSTWICALAGATYAAWFLLGASFLRLGRGRWIPLIADFTLGATSGVFAVMWPRAHLQNLAGGEALLEIGQSTSSVVLAAMATVIVIVAAMRAGD